MDRAWAGDVHLRRRRRSRARHAHSRSPWAGCNAALARRRAAAIDRLGIGRKSAWLDARGLVLVAGPTGTGKTTTLAALVRALGDKRKRVVTLEDQIEIMHVTSPWVSQRAVGYVPSVAAGVKAAMQEGVDAIVIDAVASPEAAAAVVVALAAGNLVLATIASSGVRAASDQLLALVPAIPRPGTRGIRTWASGDNCTRGEKRCTLVRGRCRP